ncbi:MAG: Pr6Pr family membrane protein [Proteobacteria bacterium]|nr:Pr6Pr family membrane protein [Pseudomonadota bacterium]
MPPAPILARPLAGLVALAGWLGVVLQLALSARRAMAHGEPAWSGVLDALCYFTILTNILVSVTATLVALGKRTWLTRPPALAAAAVYIIVVGVIYSLLLRSLWAPVGLQRLADQALHDLTPILYAGWWALCAAKGGLRIADALAWLGYPLAYFAFSLVLGATTGRYLYPFADVQAQGWPAVVRNGALLVALFLVLGAALIAAARALPGRQRSA